MELLNVKLIDFIDSKDSLNKALKLEMKNRKERLERLTGKRKLSFLLRLLKIVRLYSIKTAEDLIDKNIDLIENNRSEESAILMMLKAYFSFQLKHSDKDQKYIEKALTLLRDIGSNQAELMGMILKGWICETIEQHKLATAWYTNST